MSNGFPNRFTATPDPVTAGQTLTICFDNENLADSVVTIALDDGGTPPQTDNIEIELDSNGHGCADWTAPLSGWDGVTMSHETSKANTVLILDPN